MREQIATAHRLAAFSDAVIAVVMTIMALELKAPDRETLSALWPLWPTAISYAVSYLFIAIIWINHHYLMRFVGQSDLVSFVAPRLGFGLICSALILHLRPEPDIRPLVWFRRLAGVHSP